MTDLKMFSKPVVFTDFDGVLNAFPDDKLLRRGGVNKVMTWAKPDSPYAKMYNPEKAFHLDSKDLMLLMLLLWWMSLAPKTNEVPGKTI